MTVPIHHGDVGCGRKFEPGAIAFAREGADILVSYLGKDPEAEATAQLVRQASHHVLTVAATSDDGH